MRALMHLKSIELYGFKSFANKMVFEFDEGITGIVGPNGSGKSNIADAVRWVLGEQSAKQLRSSRMQDVIFAGTEARKPLGYSQVDLTIDNHDKKIPIDYLEVTVSRRVYRSGEGEYFINGAPCRMRDIQELFMDTGVGQEGYSIIGQGQIDKILSNKPDERRALFDEAVGIVKFKKRKKHAEKQLETEKQNLYRISDIITELEGQKEVLTDQAEKAKIYLNKKEDLKINEVTLFVTELDEINKKLEALSEKDKTAKEQIHAVRKIYEVGKIKHTDYNKIIEELEKEIETIVEQSGALNLQKEKKESDISLTKEQIHHLNENNQRLEKEKKEAIEKKNQRQATLENYQEEIATLLEESRKSEVSLTQQEEAIREINEAIEKEEVAVGDIQSNMIERLNEISTIKTQMQRFTTMAENAYSRKESIIAKKLILESSIDELREQLMLAQQVKEHLSKRATTLKERQKNIRLIQLEEAKLLEKTQKERKEKTNNLQMQTSKYKALGEIVDHYEGYNYSIRKVMSLKKEMKYSGKIKGVVADVLKVSKTYERAIEIALGGTYQNIIVEDEATAKSLIGYLKTNKYGRATFLPLTNIRATSKNRLQIKKEAGVIGYGHEVVQTEEEYSQVMAYLLGRTLVVKDLDTATRLARKYKNNLRIVTLEGDLVNPGGSLTGGAYKNNKTQFLARKRELDILKQAIEVSKKNLLGIDTSYQELLYKKEQQIKEIDSLRERLQSMEIDLNGQSMTLHQLKSDLLKGTKELEAIKMEEEQLASQGGDIASEISNLTASLKENEVNKEDAEVTVKSLMAKTIGLKEEKDQLIEKMTQLRMASVTVIEQKNHANSNVVRMKEEIATMEAQINLYETEISKNEKEITGKAEQVEAHKKVIEDYNELVQDSLGKREALTTKRHALVKEQEVLYKEQEVSNEQMTLLEKERIRLENQINKAEEAKDNHITYMWQEYEVTYNNAASYFDKNLKSITIMKEQIRQMKNEIKQLGDVNVNAIEEYKQVLERYTFLTEQKSDLVEAEEKLRGMITELEMHMQEQFIEQFKAINLRFQQVFKELFGGGKAFLELADEEEILNAGIHISAQPPGKKLQNMMLLSGGERAFTAIALLFAIQSLKPSPFCVLDEIEAALDDANVERFAKYLQKLSKATQFIIITHRRGTMEVSDALYGITMEEKGISAQVSVKLVEDIL